MTSPPALKNEHLQNAKLFSSRNDMILAFDQLKNGKVIGEVGVAMGDFSDFIIKTLSPKEFVAFDLFEIHTMPAFWGKTPLELFGKKTHLEYYQERFKNSKVIAQKGKSIETLSQYPDAHFDMLYIDADHRYHSVKADGMLAHKKIKPDGILIFNDYIRFDHISREPYGVIDAVNEIIINEGYEVIGFALDYNMFCDIAIKRV